MVGREIRRVLSAHGLGTDTRLPGEPGNAEPLKPVSMASVSEIAAQHSAAETAEPAPMVSDSAKQTAVIVQGLAGPTGKPGYVDLVVLMLALAGETEEALDYAERFGPGSFYMFGGMIIKYPNDTLPELGDEPRWQVLLSEFRVARQAEIDKFDRLVANGEIVMPRLD